jgi:hypothetical protein
MSNGEPPSRNRRRPRPAWLLDAVALTVGSALLLPSAAPASKQRSTSHSSAFIAAAGESSSESPGESTGTPLGHGHREGRAGRRSGCGVEVSVAPSVLTAGESATVTGSLTCPTSVDAAEQAVTIYQHDAGTPGFSVVGTTTTEASGAYRFTTEVLATNSVFYARVQGAHSGRVSVKLAPLVTISGPPDGTQLSIAGHRGGAGASAGNTVTFSGTVGPADAGARVVLQRESSTVNENWLRIGLGEVGADGGYSITHTFSIPGTANIRILVRSRGRRVGLSESLSYQIVRRQNPLLTIQASPGSVSYGQSVTLSGTAAQAAHEPLTLLARTRQSAFAPVATVMTDGSGGYTFPAQSPLQSTVYKVSAAHASSVTLSEGVRPLLTAQVSSSAVHAGEPLTFSGAIVPDRAGQLVYLERQNPDGVGFHRVAVGTLGTGGSYSIEHTVSSSDTQVFRIKIPGNSEDQAVASELFKISVTPVAEESPEVKAPGASSTLPGES